MTDEDEINKLERIISGINTLIISIAIMYILIVVLLLVIYVAIK